MWISKEGNIRKQELLKAALDIFSEKGYEKTSINDILKQVGVTKGSFYYYFNSKEDVLECVALTQAELQVQELYRIKNLKNNAVKKLNMIIKNSIDIRIKNLNNKITMNKILVDEQNIRLSSKIFEIVFEKSKPLFESIILQGNNEYLFSTKFSSECAETHIYLVNIFMNSITKELIINKNLNYVSTANNKVDFYDDLINKMFGTKKERIEFACQTKLLIKQLEEYVLKQKTDIV